MRLSKRGTLNWATTFKGTTADYAPMGKDEFQILCLKLQITDSLMAAKAFGLSWRTCQRYWYGTLNIPGPLARLLRLAVEYQIPLTKFFGPTRKNTRLKPKT